MQKWDQSPASKHGAWCSSIPLLKEYLSWILSLSLIASNYQVSSSSLFVSVYHILSDIVISSLKCLVCPILWISSCTLQTCLLNNSIYIWKPLSRSKGRCGISPCLCFVPNPGRWLTGLEIQQHVGTHSSCPPPFLNAHIQVFCS